MIYNFRKKCLTDYYQTNFQKMRKSLLAAIHLYNLFLKKHTIVVPNAHLANKLQTVNEVCALNSVG